ncbi:MAG: hypothetical protein ACR2F6_02710 [Mycobacteriales bacterium]
MIAAEDAAVFGWVGETAADEMIAEKVGSAAGAQPGHRRQHVAAVDDADEFIRHEPTECGCCGTGEVGSTVMIEAGSLAAALTAVELLFGVRASSAIAAAERAGQPAR